MSAIGVPLCGPDDLWLTSGRDFSWVFECTDETGDVVNFPPGQLFLEFGTEPTPTRWDFTVSGSVASIKVESDRVDQMENYTRWQLVFLPAGEAGGGSAVARGIVRVQR